MILTIVLVSYIQFFSERWQKTALLVFSALASLLRKTKCAVCAVGFFSMLPNLFILQLYWVYPVILFGYSQVLKIFI